MVRPGINSHVIVMIEKNPNASADIAEKPNANMFLNLSWRTNDTIDSNVTAKSIIASTIISSTSLIPILIIFVAIGITFVLLCNY